MRTRTTTTAAVLLAAGLMLAACSSNSHNDAKAAATTAPPTTAAATTASASSSSTAVKLSTKWLPKLKVLEDGNGVSACQDSGSTGCVEAMTTTIGTLSEMVKDINAAGAADEYAKTMADINQYIRAADAFDKAGCPGDPNADVGDSSCFSNALKVVTGPTMLEFVMPTDELTAGVS